MPKEQKIKLKFKVGDRVRAIKNPRDTLGIESWKYVSKSVGVVKRARYKDLGSDWSYRVAFSNEFAFYFDEEDLISVKNGLQKAIEYASKI